MVICPECGKDVKDAKFCSNCGALLQHVIFPGLGHFYLGLNHKGISFLVGYIISAILILLVIGFLLVFVVWIWALIDVVQSTNAINNGEYVEDKLF